MKSLKLAWQCERCSMVYQGVHGSGLCETCERIEQNNCLWFRIEEAVGDALPDDQAFRYHRMGKDQRRRIAMDLCDLGAMPEYVHKLRAKLDQEVC